MKWETVTSTIGHSAFALWNNGRKLATLVFNPASNAARIEYDDEKRVFLLRNEGFLRNKTVLCNEYGVRIAHSGSENNERFIMLNDQRYFYDLTNEQESSLTIYKESRDQPLAVCTLDMSTGGGWGKTSLFADNTHYSLLMALCLYLFGTR